MDNTYTTDFSIERGMDNSMIDMYKLTLLWIVSQSALASGETCGEYNLCHNCYLLF